MRLISKWRGRDKADKERVRRILHEQERGAERLEHTVTFLEALATYFELRKDKI